MEENRERDGGKPREGMEEKPREGWRKTERGMEENRERMEENRERDWRKTERGMEENRERDGGKPREGWRKTERGMEENRERDGGKPREGWRKAERGMEENREREGGKPREGWRKTERGMEENRERDGGKPREGWRKTGEGWRKTERGMEENRERDGGKPREGWRKAERGMEENRESDGGKPREDWRQSALNTALRLRGCSLSGLRPSQSWSCCTSSPARDWSALYYGEDEKPPLPPRSASTSTPPTGSAPETPTDSAPAANGLSTISHEYLKGSYALDLEAALKAVQDLSWSTLSSPPPSLTRHSKTIPVQAFEVKLDVNLADLTKIGKSQKHSLSVDVEAGELVLIKSQRVQNKLGIVFEKDKEKSQRKDFIFASAKKREAFCQLLQLMKNKHSNQDEPDMISIFIGTWNMGSVPSPKAVGSWLLCRGLGKTLDEMTGTIPHDLYVFGTQENSVCDREWVDSLRTALKEHTELDYKPIAVQTLWNIKIAVLVKPEHENRISHVGVSSVKTGIANTLGNKGAVGVSFMFNGTSFGFVNCHLTSGNEKIGRTNVPSWCDRILWKSYPETHIVCNSYGCTDDMVTSDHSPVFGTFEVGVTSQFVSKKEFKKSYENDSQSSDNVNFLRSMIGSTAQQFHTYLSHRGEETGNIRGSMRVRVPAERMGTRERLYEWISVDKDEMGGPKGRSTLPPRSGHDYVNYNNPAYYILEGVPNQSAAALSPEHLPSPCSPPAGKAHPSGGGRGKPSSGSSHPCRHMAGHPVRPISEEGSSEDDGIAVVGVVSGGGAAQGGGAGGTLNRPPPDFPPPPLPKGAQEMADIPFSKPRSLHPDLAEVKIPAANPSPAFVLGEGFRRGGAGGLDDQSCSVLQMAKTLSESEYPPSPPGQGLGLGDACRTFPPRAPITESIAEDLPEEALWGSSSSSLSVGESSVGEWLQRLGLERYEEGLLHNGWDDLEFLSDITEEDLEEAGVLDPAHKRILLESLRQQKQQKPPPSPPPPPHPFPSGCDFFLGDITSLASARKTPC
ncbi:unnamed protein product [Coregonus sp. 'balchen']|nr:unnamed protein product [Coregonus sp. 'balchen']